MKHKTLLFKASILLVSLCLSGFANLQAQTLLYSNDFESGLNGSTIVGNGVLEASGDPAHGQVFHNDPTVTNAVRTNYMLLPTTIFSDFQTSGSQGLTVSFWVNKSNATNYYWSAMFGAYGIAPNPTNAKPALTLMSRSTGLVNFDYVNTVNSTNYSYKDFTSGSYTSTAWLDAGGWHFYTFTITPTTAKVFIDGVEKNAWTFDGTSTNSVNGLFNVASEIKYIALGGNQAWDWNDPDPAFMFDKLKIYAGALTAAQIGSLFSTDGLSAPVLTASKSALYFDDKFLSDTIVVNGANLGSDITLVSPAGITLGKTSIVKTSATDIKVSATWNGTTVVNGNITLTSGSSVVTIPVKTSSNSCYTPAYATGNMIADPTFSAASLSAGGFSGWGPTAITNTNAYCGRGSAFIRGACWPDGGSIDRTLSDANGNALVANNTYRLRAMVNSKATTGKSFQFQIEGVDGAASILFQIPNTNGWKQIDTTFTTGTTVTTGKGIYFNSCTNAPLITDTCFIDNYELYNITGLSTGINKLMTNNVNSFVRNNKVVSSFTLDVATVVSVSLYNVNGTLIESNKSMGQSGKNERVLNAVLPSGVYVVKTTINGKFTINKIIL